MVNRRSLVLIIQDIVRVVTVCTDGAGQKAFFDQTLPMYAIGIIDGNRPLFGLYCCRMIQLAMAISTQLRDF